MAQKATAERDVNVWITNVHVTGCKRETAPVSGRRRSSTQNHLPNAWFSQLYTRWRDGYPRKSVYVIEICWSDQTRFEIHRRYADFFAFQRTLLAMFPHEAGKYHRVDRCIPYLPTADKVLQLFGWSFSTKHLEYRLRTIKYYCETILMKLGSHLSRSQFVLQFFKCQPGDKQMLGPTRSPSMHPQGIPAGSVFEEYQVTVDFTANSEEQLSLKVGETVSALSKDSSDWWYVSKGAKQSGWVPKSYLQQVTGDTEDFLDDPELEEWRIRSGARVGRRLSYLSIADYETTDPNQLTFEEGAEVMVLDKEEDGWWLAVMDSKLGWVPSSFLEPLEGELEDSVMQTTDKEDTPAGDEDASSYETFWAVRKYTAALPDEVDLPLYAEVEVVKMSYSGWWLVRLSGREGLAPATYLSPVDPQTAEAVEGDGEELIPSTDSELRGSFIKRKCLQIRSPPPRSEFVRQLSRRYRKDGGGAVQQACTVINEAHNEGKDSDIAGKNSVSVLHHDQSSPLLHATMKGIEDDGVVTASFPHSEELHDQSELESTDDSIEAIGSSPHPSKDDDNRETREALIEFQ